MDRVWMWVRKEQHNIWPFLYDCRYQPFWRESKDSFLIIESQQFGIMAILLQFKICAPLYIFVWFPQIIGSLKVYSGQVTLSIFEWSSIVNTSSVFTQPMVPDGGMEKRHKGISAAGSPQSGKLAQQISTINDWQTIFHCVCIIYLINWSAFIQDNLIFRYVISMEMTNRFWYFAWLFLNPQNRISAARQWS